MYQAPAMIGSLINSLTSSPSGLLLLFAGLLIITGMFMESLSTIMLLTPIFLPIVIPAGVDPVQFGILFVVMCEIGFLTPPLGVNVFVASAISKQPAEALIGELLPLIGVLLVFVLIIIFFPQISTWGYYYMSAK
jgi:C4-dicarboxylate transporter DctM subunit